MPDVAAGTIPVVFGDWRSGYAILDKVNGGLSIMRDPFTQAVNGKTRFHARMRVGGGLIQPEAFVGIVISAS